MILHKVRLLIKNNTKIWLMNLNSFKIYSINGLMIMPAIPHLLTLPRSLTNNSWRIFFANLSILLFPFNFPICPQSVKPSLTCGSLSESGPWRESASGSSPRPPTFVLCCRHHEQSCRSFPAQRVRVLSILSVQKMFVSLRTQRASSAPVLGQIR